MKTTYVIALIAAISAVSIGAISMNGFTVPLAIASNQESGTMMGHVEYIVHDADGNIKSYVQGDNMVVNRGDDCSIAYMFQPTSATGGADVCTNFNPAGFHFIGIGNGTITVDAADTTLLDGGATTVASSGVGGLMSVRWDNNTAATASSNGGTVVIATESPFTFSTSGAATNATTVTAAGLFDNRCSAQSTTTGVCTANSGVMNMFSAQSISVAVSDGDSLSVTWTITVGSAA
ncbi:MAG: hypothetical protein RI100_07200 [Nitrosarchaeum sp.]|jgi:hypothetical protein|uniref:hypothetical protein n=1 Tax=Nitrosarchaeum sp. TaxID=2026886 RepID=UPI002DF128F3|nr:hypothetical protein [Nitrosarchaeum sp.]